jgi:acetyl esterase/lipase
MEAASRPVAEKRYIVQKHRLRIPIGILCTLVLASGVVFVAGCEGTDTENTGGEAVSTTGPAGGRSDSLTFPVDDYTVETRTVNTSAGTVSVTYHLYQHLAYVAAPIDADYQSMDVAVPVAIDGQNVHAADAPILFDISVGGPANSNSDLALAAGYVVVSPDCRGGDNVSADGTYYGKAPAAIVDLKCAIKYVRHNDGLIPGDTDRIVSTGNGAGGALSALLGASGDSGLYQSYFDELGAADASDATYASASYCPITDLDHADGAYEWEFGAIPSGSGLVDQTLSARLAEEFDTYLTSLDLVGQSGFGTITDDNYGDYLVQAYLLPSAGKYLGALSDTDRQTYLAHHAWIKWSGDAASFTWKDYVAYVGRLKNLPAFDAFDLSTPECILFGNATADARHFTDFSLRQTGSDKSATVDASLQGVVDLMNPMYFVRQKNSGCAAYWWIRHGAKDNDTSLPVIVNLATSLQNLGKEVNTSLYWDAGHGANEDPADFVAWIAAITGYSR